MIEDFASCGKWNSREHFSSVNINSVHSSPPVSHSAQIESLKSNKSSLTTSTVCINADSINSSSSKPDECEDYSFLQTYDVVVDSTSDIGKNDDCLHSSGFELDDFLESALIQTVEVVNKDLFDFSDSICAVCETGGDLICCDGRCLRAFHLSCIGLQEEDVPDDVPFNCSDCLNFVQRCFSCKQFAFEENMVKCSSKMCGKFYHSQCTGGCEAEYTVPKSFICKLHSCDTCNEEMHNNSQSKLKQPWRCFRCPKAYDAKHRPKDVHILMEGIFLCIRHIQEEEEMPELPVELQLAISEKHMKSRDFNSLVTPPSASSDCVGIDSLSYEERGKSKFTTVTNNSSTSSTIAISTATTDDPTLSNSNGKINYEVEMILEKQRQQALHEGIKELLDHSATPHSISIPKKRKAVEAVTTTSTDVNNEEELNKDNKLSTEKKSLNHSTNSSKNHQSNNKLNNSNNQLKTEAIDNRSEISRPHDHFESSDRSRKQLERLNNEDDFSYHSNKGRNGGMEEHTSSSRRSFENSSRNNSYADKKRRYESSDAEDDGDYYHGRAVTPRSREYEGNRGYDDKEDRSGHQQQQQQESGWRSSSRSSNSRRDWSREESRGGGEVENSYGQRRESPRSVEEGGMVMLPAATAVVLQNHKKGCRRIHTSTYNNSQGLLTHPANSVSTTTRRYSDNTYDGNGKDNLRNNYTFTTASNSVSSNYSSTPNNRSSGTGMSRTARLLSGNFMAGTIATYRSFRQHHQSIAENTNSQQSSVVSKNSFVGALIRNIDDNKEKLPVVSSARSSAILNGNGVERSRQQGGVVLNHRGGSAYSRRGGGGLDGNSSNNLTRKNYAEYVDSSRNYYHKDKSNFDFIDDSGAGTSRPYYTPSTEQASRRGAESFLVSQSLGSPGDFGYHSSNHSSSISHQELNRFGNEEYAATTRSRHARSDHFGSYAGNQSVESVRGSSLLYFNDNNYYSDEYSKKLLTVDAYPARPTYKHQQDFDSSSSNVYHRHSTSESQYFHTYNSSIVEHVNSSNITGYNNTREIGTTSSQQSAFVAPPKNLTAFDFATTNRSGGSMHGNVSVVSSGGGQHNHNNKQTQHVSIKSRSGAGGAKNGGEIMNGTTTTTSSVVPIVDINDLFSQLQSCGLLPS